MKTIRIDTVKKMLDDLSKQTTEPLDHAGFGYMSEIINEKAGKDLISQKYLYESLFKKVEKLQDTEGASLRLSLCKLDGIARYLGYGNFGEMEQQYEQPIHPILQSCSGNWLCYVRRSTSKAVVLASPVQIKVEGQRADFYLQGPTRQYRGTIHHKQGCLFANFGSEDGKYFQHVYKVGSCKAAEVIQGVFVGVSSAFDPIAGRVILARCPQEMNQVKNESFVLADANDRLPQAVREYFNDYCNNNLKINAPITFDYDDLL